MTRWIRKDAYKGNGGCAHCGSWGWFGSGMKYHKRAVCAACGTPQCDANGMGHGTCSVCYHGFLYYPESYVLPNGQIIERRTWLNDGGSECRYHGCKETAVAEGKRGKKAVCAEHARKQYGADWITHAVEYRSAQWREVVD